MVFQIGKHYQHACGTMMSIIGEVNSTMYGKSLVAEEAMAPNFKPVGSDEDSAHGWYEITKGKWLSNFSRDNNQPPLFAEKFMIFNVVHPTGHYYSEFLAPKIIEDCKDQKILGTISGNGIDPQTGSIDLSMVSHEARNIRFKNNALVADIAVLDTPQGKLLWELMQEQEFEFYMGAVIDSVPSIGILGVGDVTSCKIVGVHARPKQS